ncbi:MAG: I78 family peptidase inhibitor [Pseudomonadota bacterium]
MTGKKKSPDSWRKKAGIGMTFMALGFVTVIGINSGTMKNLNGQSLVNVADIEPQAGGDDLEEEAVKDCGHYIEWIGQKVSNSALKKTGKPFRILPPNSMMTMDHNPERINVHVDESGIIENVKCG